MQLAEADYVQRKAASASLTIHDLFVPGLRERSSSTSLSLLDMDVLAELHHSEPRQEVRCVSLHNQTPIGRPSGTP